MTIDKLELVGPHKIIEVRWVKPDGGYHRACYAPGQDLSGAPDEVKAIAAKEHTPDLIQAYKEHLSNQV